MATVAAAAARRCEGVVEMIGVDVALSVLRAVMTGVDVALFVLRAVMTGVDVELFDLRAVGIGSSSTSSSSSIPMQKRTRYKFNNKA